MVGTTRVFRKSTAAASTSNARFMIVFSLLQKLDRDTFIRAETCVDSRKIIERSEFVTDDTEISFAGREGDYPGGGLRTIGKTDLLGLAAEGAGELPALGNVSGSWDGVVRPGDENSP